MARCSHCSVTGTACRNPLNCAHFQAFKARKALRFEPQRGTGSTTRQLKNAPQGAHFIWCNDIIDYPVALRNELDRVDIKIYPLRVLDDDGVSMSGLDPDLIVLDHAAELTVQQRAAFHRISRRKTLVSKQTRMGQYRISDELFTRLVRAATERNASFSDEVRRRLEASFACGPDSTPMDAVRLLEQFVVENSSCHRP